MARDWESLSDSYRHRLERGGITRTEYESGANLSAARGHGLSREALIEQIQNAKSDLFGGSRKWNGDKSEKHIRQDENGERRSTEDLRTIARIMTDYAGGYLEMYERLSGEDLDSAIHYH